MEVTRMRGGESLAEALEGNLAEWSRRTGIAVEVWALPAADVRPRVAKGVLEALAETLDNVEKHSGPRRCRSPSRQAAAACG